MTGLIIATNGGNVRWTCPSNTPPGEYLVSVSVYDHGTPPLSDTGTVKYIVRPPFETPVTANGLVGPQIRSVFSVSGQASFSIETIPGHTYRVFYKDDLNAPTWTPLGPEFVAANNSASLSDNLSGLRRFYRVQQIN